MSAREHLSEDTLLDAVYGIAGSDAEAHLRGCVDCAQRLREWHEKRSAAGSVEIPEAFLAAQRRKIYERIERPSRTRWLWAPGLAAACALAVGVFVYHPVLEQPALVQPVTERPAPQQAAAQKQADKSAEISDAQLFGDIYSMEQSLEPAAAAPARGLFEEQQ